MDSRPATDPIATRQWVSTIALLLEAEGAATRGSSIDRAVALIVAATAIESAIGLCSSRDASPPENDSFGEQLKRATAVAGLNHRLVLEIGAIRKIRNGVVRSGTEASVVDVGRATAAARELLDRYVPLVLEQTQALGPGSGIGDAVAALVPDHPVADHLRAASAAVAAGDAVAGLEHAARAYNQARIHTRPKLPLTGRRSRGKEYLISTPLGKTRTDYGYTELSTAISAVERWVTPLALGMTPAEYDWLAETLPMTIPGGDNVHWNRGEPATLPAARRAVEQVSLLVLRLHLNSSLRDAWKPGDRDW